MLSVPLEQPAQKKVIGVAMGTAKLRGVKGALRGKLINGLITNETMAESYCSESEHPTHSAFSQRAIS